MINVQSHDAIDFQCELHAIQQRFGQRYYMETEAAKEAARLWGTHCNEHGVLDQVTEILRVEHKRYSATIRLYETGKGFWLVSLNYATPMSGFGSPATVWDDPAFRAALAARRWAVERLLDRSREKGRMPTLQPSGPSWRPNSRHSLHCCRQGDFAVGRWASRKLPIICLASFAVMHIYRLAI